MDHFGMSAGGKQAESNSVLFGTSEQVGVGRGLAEFRAGRPVLVLGGGEPLLTLPVEGLDSRRLAAFHKLCEPIRPRLVITASRARSLGLEVNEPVALELPPDIDASRILTLVADAEADHNFVPEPAGSAAIAAIDLVKLAQILPAVLVADTRADKVADLTPPIVTLEAPAVARYRAVATQSLAIAGEAYVPLHSGVRTRFVVFRDDFGDDPVAVIVGTPDLSKPVPVRIHSACLTGGVILYLAQEGRGLGLANKMRTYKLQDAGLDTVDANITLGFDDDERDYGVAVRMLQMLGCTRIVLLTNNPAKLDGLAQSGIEITGRMPVETPINADNRRYMTAKAARAGHQLGHLISSLGDAAEGDEKAPRLVP
jgi:GTP cyclohydrolase II